MVIIIEVNSLPFRYVDAEEPIDLLNVAFEQVRKTRPSKHKTKGGEPE